MKQKQENTKSARVGCEVKLHKHNTAMIRFAECNAKFLTT